MDGIGLRAEYTTQGDWAFDFALALARSRGGRLKIFHWLDSPYRYRRDLVYADERKREVVPADMDLILQREYRLRKRYEARLGDFADVGFRLCEGHEGFELSRCLKRGEYDLLVLPYHGHGADLGGRSIERFAGRFRAPVVLVGPYAERSFFLNRPAVEMLDELDIRPDEWRPIGMVAL